MSFSKCPRMKCPSFSDSYIYVIQERTKNGGHFVRGHFRKDIPASIPLNLFTQNSYMILSADDGPLARLKSGSWQLVSLVTSYLWFDWLLLMTTTYSPHYFSEVVSIYIPSTDTYKCDIRITWNSSAFVCSMNKIMRLEVRSNLLLVLCITTVGESFFLFCFWSHERSILIM
jgi:hypothetical protein